MFFKTMTSQLQEDKTAKRLADTSRCNGAKCSEVEWQSKILGSTLYLVTYHFASLFCAGENRVV